MAKKPAGRSSQAFEAAAKLGQSTVTDFEKKTADVHNAADDFYRKCPPPKKLLKK